MSYSQQSTQYITIKVPPDFKEDVKTIAENFQLPLSTFIRALLSSYVSLIKDRKKEGSLFAPSKLASDLREAEAQLSTGLYDEIKVEKRDSPRKLARKVLRQTQDKSSQISRQ